MGFSINLLTLLALVLAIGLVVDDAIIVVENVNRHLEEGEHAVAAAIEAARELGRPIIAMTVVLIAVYVPIAFPGRPDRRAVHRIRLHAGRGGDDIGDRRLDPVADDELAPAEGSRQPRRRAGRHRLAAFIDRAFEVAASALPTTAARQSRIICR